jgi:hypothetical protein
MTGMCHHAQLLLIEIGFCELFAKDGPQTMILLISTSQVVGLQVWATVHSPFLPFVDSTGSGLFFTNTIPMLEVYHTALHPTHSYLQVVSTELFSFLISPVGNTSPIPLLSHCSIDLCIWSSLDTITVQEDRTAWVFFRLSYHRGSGAEYVFPTFEKYHNFYIMQLGMVGSKSRILLWLQILQRGF